MSRYNVSDYENIIAMYVFKSVTSLKYKCRLLSLIEKLIII